MTKQVTIPYSCIVWRAIRNLWPMLQARTRVKVGNGMKTSFWEDKWNGKVVMKQAHPALFTLYQLQQATVATMWTGHGWNLGLRRQLYDCEIGNVTELLNSLTAHTNLDEENKQIWQGDGKGIFSVKFAYKALSMTGDRGQVMTGLGR